MRVLVTGGAGYIGSHTAQALASAGHVPVVFDNLEKGHRWAVQWGPLVEGDLADAGSLNRAFQQHGIEAVIHFAAYTAVGESVRQPEKYFRNNAGGTAHLLEAMRRAGVRHIVFSSTAAVYGTPETASIAEEHPCQPVNPYGESKWMAERMLAACDVVPALLRYFNAAGADPGGLLGEEHEPETHLIPLALEAAVGRIPHLELYGTDYPTSDGTAVRDYVHVVDLATAHVQALEYIRANGRGVTLNLGTGSGSTVREVIAAVERVTGRTVPVVARPRRAGDAARLVADASLAKRVLGWEPRHSSLEEVAGTAWRWCSSRHQKL